MAANVLELRRRLAFTARRGTSLRSFPTPFPTAHMPCAGVLRSRAKRGVGAVRLLSDVEPHCTLGPVIRWCSWSSRFNCPAESRPPTRLRTPYSTRRRVITPRTLGALVPSVERIVEYSSVRTSPAIANSAVASPPINAGDFATKGRNVTTEPPTV